MILFSGFYTSSTTFLPFSTLTPQAGLNISSVESLLTPLSNYFLWRPLVVCRNLFGCWDMSAMQKKPFLIFSLMNFFYQLVHVLVYHEELNCEILRYILIKKVNLHMWWNRNLQFFQNPLHSHCFMDSIHKGSKFCLNVGLRNFVMLFNFWWDSL